MILLLYVDDGLLVVLSQTDAETFLNRLKAEFKVMIKDTVDNFLGIEINYEQDGSPRLNQSGYIQKILLNFGMQDAKCVSTPIEVG